MCVCMSAVSVGISEVLIKYTGKYVKIYFNMKITFQHLILPPSYPHIMCCWNDKFGCVMGGLSVSECTKGE